MNRIVLSPGPPQPEPRLSILDFMDSPELFGPLFKNPETWKSWRAFLAALYGLPMSTEAQQIYRICTERKDLPAAPFTEAYAICGRRGGKSRIAATIAAYEALAGNWADHLAPGERCFIFVIASDKLQSRQVLGYLKGIFDLFPGEVEAVLADEIRLKNRVNLEVRSASFRATRGYSTACVIVDELAFLRDEDSANPAQEIITSLLPSLMPGGKLLGISTPYSRSGLLYETFKEHYGIKDSPLLIWRGPTLTMNPTYPESTIRKMIARDRAAFTSEYEATFREDIENFLPEALVDLVCVGKPGLPSPRERRYTAFIDPSGGSGTDSMTLAIGYMQGERIIVDRLEEVRPPFDPSNVVGSLSDVMKAYGLSSATSDKYSGEWVANAFYKKAGIRIDPAPMPASELYLEFLPLVRMGRVELPDEERLKIQLRNLERKPRAGGKDLVSHPPGGHDDLANVAAGVAVMLSQGALWTPEAMEARLPVKQKHELPMNPRREQMKNDLKDMEESFMRDIGGSKIIRRGY